MDENEGEGGGCSKDNLYSRGPDNIGGNGDDISVRPDNVSSTCL